MSEPNTREIVLVGGEYVAIVDEEDLERLSHFSWYAIGKSTGSPYAATSTITEGRHRHLPMQNVILDVPTGTIVDHRDRNRLRNVKSNLRFATYQQNSFNRGISSRNSSGYKGVVWNVSRGKWYAQIGIDRQMKFLGAYDDAITAAHAYDIAARNLFGEFAATNLPEPPADIARQILARTTRPPQRSIYRGVKQSKGGRYCAQLQVRGISPHLGTFDTPVEAARAYDKKAHELLGAKAKLNFPDELTLSD